MQAEWRHFILLTGINIVLVSIHLLKTHPDDDGRDLTVSIELKAPKAAQASEGPLGSFGCPGCVRLMSSAFSERR